ncbi:hypothetical protein [Williamsia phyllosphaerae]|uniref:Uncharacterized protein n=1 Tax=Williamsia phyllosphaerae TaxID=885042 RepID=A0ABQ1V1I4_9NOCA|nr:hypothetical protein [Williamsia phyllosphaerae]GGF32209.1 hypothetical protein GCM10007298_30090 [Williamsia phyllosphaerae]
MNDDLQAIAFGSRPGSAITPMRSRGGETAIDSWMRAVAAGARGHYAAASAELDRADRSTADPAVRSLAYSTRASHLRQAGRHARARRHDGEALWWATGEATDAVARAAVLDALIGLAADSLGSARFDLADRLLARCEIVLAGMDDGEPWIWTGRLRLRHLWVRTESALYRGEAHRARTAMLERVELLDACPSVRHRIKTDLIAAAASAATGATAEAAQVAIECADAARTHGQLPLEWAATSLLVGIGTTAQGDEDLIDSEARLRRELNARGGGFTPV